MSGFTKGKAKKIRETNDSDDDEMADRFLHDGISNEGLGVMEIARQLEFVRSTL